MIELSLLDIVTANLAGFGKPVVDCLIELGFSDSKSEAKRSIQQGAVKLGNIKITDINAKIFGFGGIILTQFGPDGILDIHTKF